MTVDLSQYAETAILRWPFSEYPRRDLTPGEIDEAMDAYVAGLVVAVGGLPAGDVEIGPAVAGRTRDLTPCVSVTIYYRRPVQARRLARQLEFASKTYGGHHG